MQTNDSNYIHDQSKGVELEYVEVLRMLPQTTAHRQLLMDTKGVGRN